MNTHDIELPQGYDDRPWDYDGQMYTEGQIRAAIEADRKRRGEPVAWIRKNGFRFISEIEPQDDSEVPLYAAPQPTEPVKVPSDGDIMVEWASTPNTGDMRVDLVVFARALLARYGKPAEPVSVPLDKAGAVGRAFSLVRRLKDGEPVEDELRQVIRQIAAEPVKIPSDEELLDIFYEVDSSRNLELGDFALWKAFARALLARYSHLTAPTHKSSNQNQLKG